MFFCFSGQPCYLVLQEPYSPEMKNSFMFILLCFISAKKSASQQYYFYNQRWHEKAITVDAGIMAGTMYAFTDLGGGKGNGGRLKDLNIRMARPGISVFASLRYNYAAALRFQYTTGMLQGADSVLRKIKNNAGGRFERNLSFRTSIREWACIAEIYPFEFFNYSGTGKEPPRLSLLIAGGVGFFTFNPTAFLNGQWHALQPLRTEGQGFPGNEQKQPYKLSKTCLIAGTGFRYEINNRILLRLECLYRVTGTDYLDDVSSNNYVSPELFDRYLLPEQAILAKKLADRRYEIDPFSTGNEQYRRGNPANNDSWFSLMAGASILLGRQYR